MPTHFVMASDSDDEIEVIPYVKPTPPLVELLESDEDFQDKEEESKESSGTTSDDKDKKSKKKKKKVAKLPSTNELIQDLFTPDKNVTITPVRKSTSIDRPRTNKPQIQTDQQTEDDVSNIQNDIVGLTISSNPCDTLKQKSLKRKRKRHESPVSSQYENREHESLRNMSTKEQDLHLKKKLKQREKEKDNSNEKKSKKNKEKRHKEKQPPTMSVSPSVRDKIREELRRLSIQEKEGNKTEPKVVNSLLPPPLQTIASKQQKVTPPIISFPSSSFDNNNLITPEYWTQEMQDFYLTTKDENFDDREIQESQSNNRANWKCHEGRKQFPLNVLCTNCNQRGHYNSDCTDPVKQVICFMCGQIGHFSERCTRACCLNCGTRGKKFTNHCQWYKGRNAKNLKCRTCGVIGHAEDICPDNWRRYHSITSEADVGDENGENVEYNKTEYKSSRDVYCSVCSKKGHSHLRCINERDNMVVKNRSKPFVVKELPLPTPSNVPNSEVSELEGEISPKITIPNSASSEDSVHSDNSNKIVTDSVSQEKEAIVAGPSLISPQKSQNRIVHVEAIEDMEQETNSQDEDASQTNKKCNKKDMAIKRKEYLQKKKKVLQQSLDKLNLRQTKNQSNEEAQNANSQQKEEDDDDVEIIEIVNPINTQLTVYLLTPELNLILGECVKIESILKVLNQAFGVTITIAKDDSCAVISGGSHFKRKQAGQNLLAWVKAKETNTQFELNPKPNNATSKSNAQRRPSPPKRMLTSPKPLFAKKSNSNNSSPRAKLSTSCLSRGSPATNNNKPSNQTNSPNKKHSGFEPLKITPSRGDTFIDTRRPPPSMIQQNPFSFDLDSDEIFPAQIRQIEQPYQEMWFDNYVVSPPPRSNYNRYNNNYRPPGPPPFNQNPRFNYNYQQGRPFQRPPDFSRDPWPRNGKILYSRNY